MSPLIRANVKPKPKPKPTRCLPLGCPYIINTMDDQKKKCRICDRTRPVSFFAKQGRYYKPYCRPCYNAYQSTRGKVERSENRAITMEEFKDYWLPLLIDEGAAPWADADYKTQEELTAAPAEEDPDEDLPYEEMIARMIATAPINQATPHDS